jgi:hypothetical protein
MNAMKMTKPSRQTTTHPLNISNLSAIQTLAAHNVINNASSSYQISESSIIQPSAPQLEDLPPAYLEDLPPTYSEAMQSSNPSSSYDSLKEPHHLYPRLIKQDPLFSAFDENEQDEEYQYLFAQAQKNNSSLYLQDLIDSAYTGNTETVVELMETIRIEIGTLPLRAAIKGGCLETVEAIIPYYTPLEAKSVLFDTAHYNQTAITQFLVKKYNLKFNCSDLRKALEHGEIKNTILDIFVANGLQIKKIHDPFADEEDEDLDSLKLLSNNPLYVAITAGFPDTVSYFLEKRADPLFCETSLLEAAKIPLIKKIVLQAQIQERDKHKKKKKYKKKNTKATEPFFSEENKNEDSGFFSRTMALRFTEESSDEE